MLCMWIDEHGVRYFNCQDLYDASVTRYRCPHPLGFAPCRPACHGWGDWRGHAAGPGDASLSWWVMAHLLLLLDLSGIRRVGRQTTQAE